MPRSMPGRSISSKYAGTTRKCISDGLPLLDGTLRPRFEFSADGCRIRGAPLDYLQKRHRKDHENGSDRACPRDFLLGGTDDDGCYTSQELVQQAIRLGVCR